jgi:GNAT superfamily N-acetyltransferase
MDELYDTIGNLNLFMQCESPNGDAFRALPDGYSYRLCRNDELESWKNVVAEAQFVDYVTDYYNKVYVKHGDEFYRRCLFICESEDKPVASCIIWRSYGLINTVGWLRVLPEYEGNGLGRALLSKILKDVQFPVYLHTQPTSLRAIKLYSDFGFKLITDPMIGYRKNDLTESLPYLRGLLLRNDYAKLQFTKADNTLLVAAQSSELAEF